MGRLEGHLTMPKYEYEIFEETSKETFIQIVNEFAEIGFRLVSHAQAQWGENDYYTGVMEREVTDGEAAED